MVLRYNRVAPKCGVLQLVFFFKSIRRWFLGIPKATCFKGYNLSSRVHDRLFVGFGDAGSVGQRGVLAKRRCFSQEAALRPKASVAW